MFNRPDSNHLPFFTQPGFTGPLVSVPLSRIFKESRNINCQNGKIFKEKPFCFPASELKANVTYLGNTHHGKKKASKAFLSLHRPFCKSVINYSTLLPLCFKIISSSFIP